MSTNVSALKQNSEYSLLPSQKEAQSTKPLPLPQFETAYTPSWKDRTITQLNQWDTALDQWMPNWILQAKIDQLGSYIQDTFSSLTTFNTWLRSNGEGEWYIQLATSLAKLPLRSAHNIVNLLFSTIKGILYTATHPLKGLNAATKHLILLAHALTQPETWGKIGAGMIGATFGQALILSSPISLISIGIGSACLIAGVSFGALKAAIEAQEGKKLDAALSNVTDQFKQLPESLLTGFFMGLLIGGIRKAMTKNQDLHSKKTEIKAKHPQITNLEEAKAYANKFTTEHNLPPPDRVEFNPVGTPDDLPGTVVIQYGPEASADFYRTYYPDMYISPDNLRKITGVEIHLYPKGTFESTYIVTSYSA